MNNALGSGTAMSLYDIDPGFGQIRRGVVQVCNILAEDALGLQKSYG